MMNDVELQETLPSAAYTETAGFLREKNELFANSWFCSARDEDIPNRSSAIIVDILGESIILARLQDGSLRAHFNVCRHRGSKLCGQDDKWGLTLNGGIDREFIRCPYHQWTYGLDGKLINAPHLSNSLGFDRSKFTLYPVGVGTWGGFVFLKLDPGADEILPRALNAADIGHAPRRLNNYPLDVLKTAHVINYDVDANWKVIAENYNECYHCGGVHPELCDIVPLFRKGGGSELDWENGIPHREGAWTYTMSGTTNRKPFKTLNKFERVRHKGELIYPNLMLSMSAEHGAAFVLWPLSASRTRVECRFLFDPEEMARRDFAPEDAIDFWDITNRQDWAICERVQLGMNSRVHEHGFYAPMEDDSVDIRKYVEKYLGSEESDM
jgi:glycine betaine catabolism A